MLTALQLHCAPQAPLSVWRCASSRSTHCAAALLASLTGLEVRVSETCHSRLALRRGAARMACMLPP